jgi:hypothetical protein
VAKVGAGNVQVSKAVGSNRQITASEGTLRSHQQHNNLTYSFKASTLGANRDDVFSDNVGWAAIVASLTQPHQA